MKKYAIILGVVALLLLAGGYALHRAGLFAEKGAILEGLVRDVSNFYGEKKRLPMSWDEFIIWAHGAHTASEWTAEELNPRFALKWGAYFTEGESPPEKILIVLDPEFKDIEAVANRELYERSCVSAKYPESR